MLCLQEAQTVFDFCLLHELEMSVLLFPSERKHLCSVAQVQSSHIHPGFHISSVFILSPLLSTTPICFSMLPSFLVMNIFVFFYLF